MSSQSTGLRPAFLLFLATFLWGAVTVANKALLGRIEPLALLAIQLAPGFVAAAALALSARARFPRGRDLRLALLLGALNPGLSYSLGLTGLERIGASLAALLWACEPVMILALAALVLREAPGRRLVAVIALALIGVVLVVGRDGGGADPAGVALTLAAVALCAVYTVLSRGPVQRCAPLALLAVQHGAGLGWALAAAMASGSLPAAAARPDAAVPAAAAAAGFLYYGLSYWLYLRALREVPAAVAGAWFNLIPLVALILAAVFLGERLTGPQFLGAALILAAGLGLLHETAQRSAAR